MFHKLEITSLSLRLDCVLPAIINPFSSMIPTNQPTERQKLGTRTNDSFLVLKEKQTFYLNRLEYSLRQIKNDSKLLQKENLLRL